jgi:hypothetical protein
VHQWRSGNQPLAVAEVPKLMEEIPSPTAHIRAHPGEFVLGYGYRWSLLLRNLARQLGYVLIPLVGVGAVAVWRKTKTGLALLLLPVFLLPVLAFVGTFTRHSFVPGACLVAVSGVGLVFSLEILRRLVPDRRSGTGPR